MEALLPHSALGSRSQPMLMVRPTTTGNGHAQSFLRTSRFVKSRIIGGVANSDCPNRKSRKTAAFRGYVPRLPAESSIKKTEHVHDEETIGTYNRLLSSGAEELTRSRDVETGEVDLLQNASSSSTSVLEMLEVELSGNALINISSRDTEEDMIEVNLLGFALSDAAKEEVDLVDEVGAIRERFDVDLSGQASSSGTYANVDEVDEPEDDEVTFETDMSGTASSSARMGKLKVVDAANVEKDTFEMDCLISASGTATFMVVESSEETFEAEHEQWQYPTIPSASIEDKDMNETHESLKPELMSLVRVQEEDKLVLGVDEGSIVDTHVEYQPAADYHWKQQNVTAFDEQKQSAAQFPKQDLSIPQFLQNHDIVGSQKQDVGFSEQNQEAIGSYEQDQSLVHSHEQEQYITGSDRQDESIVVVPEKIQSIVGYSKPDQSIVGYCKPDQSIVVHKQDESIIAMPEQIQSIVGYSKPEQSITDLCKQQESIVHIHEEKQSIVGFHKQDLSIAGTSKESESKKLDIPGSHDAFHTKGVEAKDGNYTFQKTDADMFHAKSDVDLLQKHEEDFNKAMIEEQKNIVMDEEQRIVTEEDIPVVEVEMETGEDRFLHQLSEEESLWADDEVGITEDEESYEVDETSVSAEQDIQESPQDDMDPQALQRMLQQLAEKNYSLGNNLFVFPEVLKADSTIALYFNRDLSALANEPDVLIKGAFNGWKWRFFTEKLHKSELGGDWWSCKLYIPKQAYRFDFVFFNGRTIYENNGSNDFVMQVESTMDEHLFESFLAEEKQREFERQATEEAERKKQTEEQRRMEEEKVANEADRAHARAEVGTKKIKLHNLLGSASASADNLWYIEPITTGPGATVRLYYNRNSRPLVHSTEIWMHGGYNNWIGGLSFSERLVHCDEKDGDWWYADGMSSHS